MVQTRTRNRSRIYVLSSLRLKIRTRKWGLGKLWIGGWHNYGHAASKICKCNISRYWIGDPTKYVRCVLLLLRATQQKLFSVFLYCTPPYFFHFFSLPLQYGGGKALNEGSFMSGSFLSHAFTASHSYWLHANKIGRFEINTQMFQPCSAL